MLHEKIAQIKELLEMEMEVWDVEITNQRFQREDNVVLFTVKRLSYNDRILVKVPLDDFDTVPELLDAIEYKLLDTPITKWYKGLIVR